jgi:hypothetical protein
MAACASPVTLRAAFGGAIGVYPHDPIVEPCPEMRSSHSDDGRTLPVHMTVWTACIRSRSGRDEVGLRTQP